MLDKQFVFLFGAPRSGTTWLQAMLGAHPSICTTDELKLFDFYVGTWMAAWEELLRIQEKTGGYRRGLTGVWSEEEFHEFLRGFLRRVYERVVAKKPTATVILDKTPDYARHVGQINTLLPHAKFIHLIRDGRDVAVSLQAAAHGWGKVWAPACLESAANLWKTDVLAARQASKFADRYLEVRFEDLLGGARTLEPIFRFIGVPIETREIEVIFRDYQFEKMQKEGKGVSGQALPQGFFRKGQIGDWQNRFRATDRYVFHSVAGDLLCSLGYAEPTWWAKHGYERLTLPVSAVLSGRREVRRARAVRALKELLGPRWTDWLRQFRNRSLRRASEVAS